MFSQEWAVQQSGTSTPSAQSAGAALWGPQLLGSPLGSEHPDHFRDPAATAAWALHVSRGDAHAPLGGAGGGMAGGLGAGSSLAYAPAYGRTCATTQLSSAVLAGYGGAALSAAAPEFVMAIGAGAGAGPSGARPAALSAGALGREPAAQLQVDASYGLLREPIRLSPTAAEFVMGGGGGGALVAGASDLASSDGFWLPAAGPAAGAAGAPPRADGEPARLSIAAREFRPKTAPLEPRPPAAAASATAAAAAAATGGSSVFARLAYRSAAGSGGQGGGGAALRGLSLVEGARVYVHGGALDDELRAALASEVAPAAADDPRADALEGTAVRSYHSLVALDERARGHSARAYGVPTAVYRATSADDGGAVALRRVDGSIRVGADELARAAARWLDVQHPNLVELRGAFVSDECSQGLPRPWFVHAFWGGARTVEAAYFVDAAASDAPPSEDGLWEMAAQLATLLLALHALGMSARGLEPARLLLTGGGRVRLNGCAILDVTRPDQRGAAESERDDVASLGRLLVALACRSPAAASAAAIPSSLERLRETYSAQFSQLVATLLAPDGRPACALADALPLLAARALEHAANVQAHNDELRAAVRAQAEHGRLARLLIKLGFVNERPEYDGDPAWSETGDRYPLKLLRDALFHQVDDEGLPLVNYAHVVSGLNRLDVGADEYVLLHGRDVRQTLLVASYRDLRGLLEQSFADLVAAQQASPLEHVRAELGADSGDELDEQSLALRGMLHGLALDGDALGDRSDDSRHFGGRGASAEHLQLRHGAGGGYREPSHRELGGALSGSGLSAAPRW